MKGAHHPFPPSTLSSDGDHWLECLCIQTVADQLLASADMFTLLGRGHMGHLHAQFEL